RRAVLGRRRPEGLRRAQEVGRQDRQRRRRPRGGGEEAVRADHRRLDPEGQRQGRGRRQDPRRVPRRAEESRRGPVSAPERGWERRTDAILGVAASAILLAMMLLTFAHVVARYVFNRPGRGASEVSALSLGPGPPLPGGGAPVIEGVVGLTVMMALAFLRVPIAYAMGIVGVVGYAYMRDWNWAVAFAMTQTKLYETGRSYTLSVVPLF